MALVSAAMMLMVAVFLLLLLCASTVVVMAAPEQQTMVFRPCPGDIVAYFRFYYPQYQEPAAGAGRRRRAATAEAEEDDVETLLRDRIVPRTASDTSQHQRRVLEEAGNQTTLRSAGIDFPAPHHSVDSFVRPPADAWQKAKMALSGCTSCSNGCCDATDIVLECGRMSVPLNYTAPGDRQISLMTYRVRATGNLQAQPTDRKQLWMLQGGPGGSGLSILFLAVPSLEFATDIYIPDHRGTGLSSTLTCPTVVTDLGIIPPSSAARCVAAAVERGADGVNTPVDPRLYTVTSAARDLAALIHSQHQAGVPVYVHGYSYGTRWASRLLQLFPTIASKVVLEGNVAKTTVFNDFAAGSQAAGTRFMAKCQLDVKCRAAVNDSTILQQVATLAQQGQTNPCTTLMMGSSATITMPNLLSAVQSMLAQGLRYGVDGPYSVRDESTGNLTKTFVDFRTFYLALVSRWARCRGSAENYRAFAAGIAWHISLQGGYAGVAALSGGEDMSHLLYQQIASSELRRYPVESQVEYDAAKATSTWGAYSTYNAYYLESALWEGLKYSVDEYMFAAPQNVTADVLVLNGEIDGNTFASQAVENYADITTAPSSSKRIAIVPDAGHHASGFGCGRAVTKAFYQDNSSAPACGQTADLLPPVLPLSTAFSIHPSLLSVIMGNPATVFEGDVAAGYCRTAPSSSALGYCRRCFDYCLFTHFAGMVASPCECAQHYGACLKQGAVYSPTSECTAFTGAYSHALGYTVCTPATGQCASSCTLGVNNGYGSAVLLPMPSPAPSTTSTTASPTTISIINIDVGAPTPALPLSPTAAAATSSAVPKSTTIPAALLLLLLSLPLWE